jgi:hypothetical protein
MLVITGLKPVIQPVSKYPAIALDYPVKLGNDDVIVVVMTLMKHTGVIPGSSAVLRANPCKLLLKNNELRFVS